ncbi:MAG: FAD-binding oxidoreductase [Turicibacter bilis]
MDFNALSGVVVTKESPNYEECCLSWNRAIEKHPLVIVYCQENQDVIQAIKWAKQYGVPFRIRSGTHHYEGYSTGDQLLVIDVSCMNRIELNETTVKVQGGVRNRELYEAVCGAGYPFPGGGCPTVGVAGYTLGGGWGYSSRLFGLGCDQLIEAEVITAEGQLIVANANQHEDLFWALRGSGGGNFGVVTSLTYRLPEKIEMATLINIDYEHVGFAKVVDVALRYQRFFKNLDRRLNLKMAMYNSETKGKGVKLTGLFYGSKEEAQDLLSLFQDATDFDFYYMTVLQANREIQDSHPEFEMYRSGGRFIHRDYSADELLTMLDLIDERAQGSLYTAITFYGLGGAIADIEKDETAFYYRDASFILGFQSVWEDPKYRAINNEWVLERFNVLATYTRGSFINFPIVQPGDYEKNYYGDNLEALKAVKRKYDPEGIFNFEQAIKP